MSIKYLGLF